MTPQPAGVTAAPAIWWRLRVVDEPPQPGDEVLHLAGTAAAQRTAVLASTGRSLRQASGPPVSSSLVDEVTRQLLLTGLGSRLWGIAPARVGPSVDLVADGSALRVHAVCDGALVRTQETLTFQHGAGGAATLLAAAAAYQRLPWQYRRNAPRQPAMHDRRRSNDHHISSRTSTLKPPTDRGTHSPPHP